MTGWRSAAMVASVAALATASLLHVVGRSRRAEVESLNAAAGRRLEELAEVRRLVRALENLERARRDRMDVIEWLQRARWEDGPLPRLASILEGEPELHALRISEGRLVVLLRVDSRAPGERLAARLERDGVIQDAAVRKATPQEVPGGGVAVGGRLRPPPAQTEEGW